MVGEDPASKIYVRNKSKACEELGIEYEEFLLKEETTQQELLDLIKENIDDVKINENFILKLSDGEIKAVREE